MKIDPNRRVKRGWMNLRIERIDEDCHDTRTLFFSDADQGGRQFDYVAGQYLTFRFDDVSEKPLVRSYTMSSSPREADLIAVTVKEVEDPFISKILVRDSRVGQVLRARGPIGKFVFDSEADQDHLVMIAGGSGVTPFISILREYMDRLGQAGAPKKMSLLVSYRSKKDLILWNDIQTINKHQNCKIITTLSRENAEHEGFWFGRIHTEMIDRLLDGDYRQCTFMTCGPEAIMKTAVESARMRGVSEANIKTESFSS
jgi:ring-1,2-phenylacetyl-CoA epoxidase subunit PaaE